LPTLTNLLSVFVATKEILEISDGFPLVKYTGRVSEPADVPNLSAVIALFTLGISAATKALKLGAAAEPELGPAKIVLAF